jgi:protein phosphatase
VSPIKQVGFKTDPGRKRRLNEDAYVVEPPLFAVADGIGGAQAGEVASGLTVAALREGEGEGQGAGEQHLTDLIQEANRRVYERANEDATAAGMGTTVTVALVEDGVVSIGHVGDSRAYLIRDGRLEQLTDDHTLVAELVRSGRLSPDEADVHPQRSVITRAIGTDPDVDVDTLRVETKPGDLFMLCSDGLSDMVSDSQILSIIEESRDNLKGAAQALVRAANKGGGDDNITVIFFEVGQADEPLEETARYPVLTDEPGEDEETLDEVDGVPAVGTDTMIVSPEDARRLTQAAADPTPPASPGRAAPQRSRVVPLLLIILGILAMVALLVWGLAR